MPTAAEKLDTYRRDINLVDFLEAEGFRVNVKKGLRHGKWVVLEEPGTGRKLIVARATSGQYQYFNPEDERDRGTVVDYVAGKLGLDLRAKDGWRELFSHLDRHQGHSSPVPAEAPSATILPALTGAVLSPSDFDLRPFTEPAYLMSRGITEKTLGSAEFYGKIFNRDHRDKRGFLHTNTVFPLENKDGLLGIVIRNHRANYINGTKGEGLWVSNAVGTAPPAELFVCESPIDALSYHQMHPPEAPGQRVYVATAGTLSVSQPGAIQALIDRLWPGRVVLANDNDPSGMRYNLQLLGAVRVGEASALAARVTRFLASGCVLSFRQLHQPGESTVCTTQLAETLSARLNHGVRAGERRAEITVNQPTTGAGILTVTMPRERVFLLRAERALLELRGLSGALEVRRPVEKDWNDELKAVQQRQVREASLKPQSPTFGGRRNAPRVG
jgi:hypothetical protein